MVVLCFLGSILSPRAHFYFFSKRWLFEKHTPVNKRWRILGKS